MKTFVQIYNPREDSADMLRELFIGREGLLDEILDDLLRQITSASRQHWMIRGNRGHGKTHLAAMIYHSILGDAGLSAAYQPIWLSEAAAYEVYSAGSFLERIANELTQEPAALSLSDELRQQLSDLHGEGDDPHFFDAILELLKNASGSLGKTLVVIVENFDSLLNGFSPKSRKAEAQRVRSMMQHDREFLFVGTTPTHYLPGLSDPDKPLYGQFRERKLEALTEDESEDLFDRLAVSHGESSKKGYLSLEERHANRKRVFHQLTGGSPRSVVMLFHVVTGVPGIEGLVNDLRSLLDVHTSYFEARLSQLAPRERVIIAALSSSEENLTAQQIARQTRLPERSISTQLKRLVEEGHVTEAAVGGGKGTVYEVSDGMLRLWHQFRRGRKLLEPVVRFLSYWYSPEELTQTISLLSQESAVARNRIERQQAELTLRHVEEAYRFRTSEEGKERIERFLNECGTSAESFAVGDDERDVTVEAKALYERGNFEGAIRLLEHFLAESDPSLRENDIARAMFNLGLMFQMANRTHEATEAYRSIVTRFGEREEPALLEPVAMAFVNLSNTLYRAGRTDEAIEIYRLVVARFGEREEPALLEDVAMALVNLGIALGDAGRRNEEVETYRSVVARFGEREEPQLLEAVARALVNLGNTLDRAGRTDEAIETYRSVVARFGEREEPQLLEAVARALGNLGNTFDKTGRTDEAIEIYRSIVTRFGEREEPVLLKQVGRALVNLGITFDEAGRRDEEIETYRSVVARFGEREEPALLEGVAKALVNLGNALAEAGRTDEGIESYRSVVARFGEREEPALLEQVAMALVNLGVALGKADRRDEEIEAYRSVVARFGEREEPALLEEVARALFNLGITLDEAGRRDEEIETYRSVVARFGEREEPALLEGVARALINLGNALGEAGRRDEEIETYRSVVARFGEREEPALLEQVAMALVNLGITFGEAGRTDKAIEAFQSVVARFGEREEPALREQLAWALVNLGVALNKAGRSGEAIDVYQSMIESFDSSDSEAIVGPMLVAFQGMIDILFRTEPERAGSVAGTAVAFVIRRAGHVPLEAFFRLLRSLLLNFDEADVRQWIDQFASLEDAREIAAMARLNRFVVNVLKASKAGKRDRLSPKARRERALGRVPSEFRQTVVVIVDDILRERRNRAKELRRDQGTSASKPARKTTR